MKNEIFEKIIKNRIKVCKEILIQKGKEYSNTDDRLINFRVAEFTSGKDVKSKEFVELIESELGKKRVV